MTRHAKKTHSQFYEARSSDRSRQTTPLPEVICRTDLPRNTRKERSISDPGPVPIFRHVTQQETAAAVIAVKRPFQGQVIIQATSAPGTTSDSMFKTDMDTDGSCGLASQANMYRNSFLHINNSDGSSGSGRQLHAVANKQILVTTTTSREEVQHKNGIIDSISRVTFTVDDQKMLAQTDEEMPALAALPHKQQELLGIKVSDLHHARMSLMPKTEVEPRGQQQHQDHQIIQDIKPGLSFILKPKQTDYFEEQKTPEGNIDMKTLLAEKSQMDFACFMNDCYNSDDSPQQHQQPQQQQDSDDVTKLYLDPPSPESINDDSLLRRLCAEEPLIKLEPDSPPATPPPTSLDTPEAKSQQQQQNLLGPSDLNQGQGVGDQVPRPIYFRSPSQDFVTKTKNPVLPSIHTEHRLVVPELNKMKYAMQENLPLDFGEEKDQLTELRGTLFLPDEYSQSIPFQPWI